MPDHHIAPFVPPRREPLQTHLDNVLLTRQHPWKYTLWEHTVLARPEPGAFAFSPVAHIRVPQGDQCWYVELDSLAFIHWHPALADLPATMPVPEELQLALLDLACAPVQTAIAHFTGQTFEFSEAAWGPAPVSSPVAALTLSVHAPDAQTTTPPFAVRIHVPDRQHALFLADRLATLPLRAEKTLCTHLSAEVSSIAGSMPITIAELADVQPGDVLLPQDYHAAQGTIILRPCSWRSENRESTPCYQDIRCTIQDNQATVVAITRTPKESAMTTDPSTPQTENSTTETAPQSTATTADTATIDTGALEVELCFELDRRLMSITDMAALVPGYTFTLGCDPLAPVTLRVHGTVVGMGRLVDISGLLGVQVTSLAQPGGQDAGL